MRSTERSCRKRTCERLREVLLRKSQTPIRHLGCRLRSLAIAALSTSVATMSALGQRATAAFIKLPSPAAKSATTLGSAPEKELTTCEAIAGGV